MGGAGNALTDTVLVAIREGSGGIRVHSRKAQQAGFQSKPTRQRIAQIAPDAIFVRAVTAESVESGADAQGLFEQE